MQFTRGATFDLSGPVSVLKADGTQEDISDWTVSCKIMFTESQKKIAISAELLLPPVNDVFFLRIWSAEPTSTWPLGPVDIDVLLTSPDGDKVPTPVTRFTVVKGVSVA